VGIRHVEENNYLLDEALITLVPLPLDHEFSLDENSLPRHRRRPSCGQQSRALDDTVTRSSPSPTSESDCVECKSLVPRHRGCMST
jgi:hypothetical protein